jgi:hypothetical protein
MSAPDPSVPGNGHAHRSCLPLQDRTWKYARRAGPCGGITITSGLAQEQLQSLISPLPAGLATMSFEALLTVITVVLAALAIIPQERGQDLRIRLGGSATALATFATAVVLYWALLEPLHTLPGIRRLPRFIPWLDGWDPGSSSLALFLFATVYAWWTFGRHIPVGRLPKLGGALSDALARRRFAGCMHLVEAHLQAISAGLAGHYWQLQLRKRLFPTVGEIWVNALKAERSSGNVPLNDPASIVSLLERPPSPALPLPVPTKYSRLAMRFAAWAERPSDAAHDIVRSLSLSPQLVRHIAAANPYLGLRLSELPSTWLGREFAETFAKALFSDAESVLYRELRRAENIDSNNVPVVDRIEQPLLAALCVDGVKPDGPRLLYTFLEAGIDALRGGAGNALKEVLNQPLGDYHDRTRWFSPPFATIYLIEITAPRNAVSAEAATLNLYVVSNLVTTLLQELSPSNRVDLTQEWPTPTHYLLYESVSVLVDLVAIWRDRPADLPAEKLADTTEKLPDILPAHAIDVLSSVMYTVLRSDKLDGKFKGYLLEVWWKAYWQKYKPAWAHSNDVLSGLVKGGHIGTGDMKHGEGLAEAIRHVDMMTAIGAAGDQVRTAFGLPTR